MIQIENGPKILTGTGSPEGVVTAPVGYAYMRTDGVYGATFYVKQHGVGNTGWTALASESGTFTQMWLSADQEQWIGVPSKLPTQVNRTYGANVITLRLLGLTQNDAICAVIKTPPGYTGGAILCESIFTVNVSTVHGTRSFAIGVNAVGNGDAIPTTVAGEGTFNIVETTNDVMYYSPVVSVTPQNSPAPGDVLMLRLRREADGVNNQIDFVGMNIRWPTT